MTPPQPRDRLAEAIANGEARVAVLGLGYVGLPLALAFAEAGMRVLGFDIDPAKTDALTAGRSYIAHIDEARVRRARDSDLLAATCDPRRLADVDVLVICVPTPLDDEQRPDLTAVERTTALIAEVLRPGQLVVLESTTYPGTTDSLVRPGLEASGLVAGRDFFLAYSPEREDPGNSRFTTTSIPKVVGGVDEVSGDLAQALYDRIVERTVRVSSAAVAEATKLTENVFRAVNIALVNELKIVYDRLGLDVWEVLDAAETKPFGYMRFDPGPGWGGHCIPIDPFYLSWRAEQVGLRPRFIQLAGEVNVEMPGYVIERLGAALAERDAGRIAGSRILLLGLAYKRDVADPRESPAFEILDRLLEAGAEVAYHDPWIPEAPSMRTWSELPALRSMPLTPDTLRAQDAVIVVTDHSAIDWALVLEHARLIVDTRRAYRTAGPTVVRA